MVTYYVRFIPNASTITTPLPLLLRQNVQLKWSNNCKRAFGALKHEIASDRVLMPFNSELPVQLACDAVPTGIAGVLSHQVDGTQERPYCICLKRSHCDGEKLLTTGSGSISYILCSPTLSRIFVWQTLQD